MSKIWVLVAESSRANIYSLISINHPLQCQQTLTHEASRLHDKDLTSDLPGRAFDGKTKSMHALRTDISPKALEAAQFARILNHRLEAARIRGQFDTLMIVAPPEFLGLLRKQMSGPLRQCIRKELQKNLSHHSPKMIVEQLVAA